MVKLIDIMNCDCRFTDRQLNWLELVVEVWHLSGLTRPATRKSSRIWWRRWSEPTTYAGRPDSVSKAFALNFLSFAFATMFSFFRFLLRWRWYFCRLNFRVDTWLGYECDCFFPFKNNLHSWNFPTRTLSPYVLISHRKFTEYIIEFSVLYVEYI